MSLTSLSQEQLELFLAQLDEFNDTSNSFHIRSQALATITELLKDHMKAQNMDDIDVLTLISDINAPGHISPPPPRPTSSSLRPDAIPPLKIPRPPPPPTLSDVYRHMPETPRYPCRRFFPSDPPHESDLGGEHRFMSPQYMPDVPYHPLRNELLHHQFYKQRPSPRGSIRRDTLRTASSPRAASPPRVYSRTLSPPVSPIQSPPSSPSPSHHRHTLNQRYRELLKTVQRHTSPQNNTHECDMKWMSYDEHAHYEGMTTRQKIQILTSHDTISRSISPTPLRFQVLLSNIPDETKAAIFKRLQSSHAPGESAKYAAWVDTMLSIPFGKINPLPVTMHNTAAEISEYLGTCERILDDCVLGHTNAKQVIKSVIAGWIRTNGNSSTINALGITGPVGVGKTTLIRNGLSKAAGRPFSFISCGGSSGGSLLNGHSFTYEGSMPGSIVESVISAKCLNPVIMLDEVDKISTDARGEEVLNVLVHLLDPSSNQVFQDRFLGIPIDISKAFFVLTYNDPSKLPPVLRDRIFEVQMDDFTMDEKIEIANKFIVPEIFDGLGLEKTWATIDDETMAHILKLSESAPGLRQVRHSLTNIVSAASMLELSKDDGGDEDYFAGTPPFKITVDVVDHIMHKMRNSNMTGGDDKCLLMYS